MKIVITTKRRDNHTRKFFTDIGVSDEIIDIADSILVEFDEADLVKPKDKVNPILKKLFKDNGNSI